MSNATLYHIYHGLTTLNTLPHLFTHFNTLNQLLLQSCFFDRVLNTFDSFCFTFLNRIKLIFSELRGLFVGSKQLFLEFLISFMHSFQFWKPENKIG